jgi:UbiD family decarboxylase
MRNYLKALDERGEFQLVRRRVDPRFELSAVVEKVQQSGAQPLLFTDVAGTDMLVVSNIYASNDRLCEMIGATRGEFCRRWDELLGSVDTRAPYIERAAVPTPRVPIAFDALPRITWRGKDDGPYITAGVFYAKDPETGVGNLSFCRASMRADGTLLCCIDPPHDLARYQALAEARGEPLDVAILIGPAPEIFLAACASIPYEQDELGVAAAIRGAPVPMRPASTLPFDLPDESEIVIEGRIRPHERRPEGPFGEYMGYYGPLNANGYVFDVTAVTAREGAVFHGLLCGGAEDLCALDVAFATRTYGRIARKVPGVIDVTCNPMFFCSVVKIDKSYEAQPREVIQAVFDANPNYNFACIVVDKDVDIHDLQAVMKAFLTRGRVDRRVTVVDDVRGWDDSADPIYAGRLGIDATMTWGREENFDPVSTPWPEIQLDEYLDPPGGPLFDREEGAPRAASAERPGRTQFHIR